MDFLKFDDAYGEEFIIKSILFLLKVNRENCCFQIPFSVLLNEKWAECVSMSPEETRQGH